MVRVDARQWRDATYRRFACNPNAAPPANTRAGLSFNRQPDYRDAIAAVFAGCAS